MNPAVTIALASLGQISIVTGALYIMTQCVGTALGAQILVGLTPSNFTWSLGSTQLASGVSPMQGEVICVCKFVLNICIDALFCQVLEWNSSQLSFFSS